MCNLRISPLELQPLKSQELDIKVNLLSSTVPSGESGLLPMLFVNFMYPFLNIR